MTHTTIQTHDVATVTIRPKKHIGNDTTPLEFDTFELTAYDPDRNPVVRLVLFGIDRQAPVMDMQS